ncbi:phage tail protein [Paenibacillus graminis]|uniref:phage tail protein n=1 Tax=Paenibacillus graminis TaxID=189425 RepID=UPI002DBBE0A3|nr:phage tail protein [Paenibacillus graminis]MEC0167846.1 phage tail protein [Paenibacillus graminis]
MINALQSYDRFRKRIGILRDAYDVTRTRRINADYTLTFNVPMASDDFRDKLPLKGHVMDERGQYYVINSRQRNRDDRKLTAKISCSHVMFKLADYKFPYASYVDEGFGYHITQLTSLITAATGGVFSISVDDTFDLADVKAFGGGNCLEALNFVIDLYGAEVEPDNFTLHLRKKIGNPASDYRVALTRNLLTASFTDSATSLCTRLYAEMKDSRTWIGQPASILTADEQARLAAIPGAIVDGILRVNYLVSPYASAWASDTVPFYDDLLTEQDVTDPLKLLAAARLRMAEREVPALEVSVSAADLFKIDKQEARPGLGDTVTLVDPALGLTNITARITEMTEYPYSSDRHTQLTVANVMRRDYTQIVADLEAGRRAIENVFSGGRIRAEVFEEFARLAVHDINNSKTELIYPPEGGILAQDKADPRNQVRLTSAGLGVSTDGWQTIRAAITARGVVAETIVGQQIYGVSLVIGVGNNVTKINPHGISAGHDDYNSAPFRVDMEGNVVANRLTANSANIFSSNFTNGVITGSSINVGNGVFTVDTAGNMRATSGEFSGFINASYITGTDITGGTITGAKIQTSASVYPRVVIDPTSVAFGVYADAGSGIQIPAFDNGVSKILFNAGGGLQSALYNSPVSGLIVSGDPDVTISGNNVKLSTTASGQVIIAGWERLYNGATTLAAELSAIWAAINSKSNVGHTHSVSIPNHNHGNPANATSGGGTFTTSAA